MPYSIRAVILAAFFITFLMSGCDGVLDISPRSSVSPDDMGSDDVEQLLNGVYRQFQNGPGQHNVALFDALGGNLQVSDLFRGGATERLVRNEIDPQDGAIFTIWYAYYRGLYRANTLLEVLENAEATPRNEEIRGIAHFFRAYAYYGLVTRYGDVPILTETTHEHVERDSESEVWTFIQQELERAIDLAPSFASNSDYYYVTSEAAKALLARTALAVGDMDRAAQLAEEVIQSGHFSLEDDFESIFRGSSNTETIFAFENHADEGIPYSRIFTTVGFSRGGSYMYFPSDEVLSSLFADEDERKEVSFTYWGDEDLPMVNKYHGGQTGGDPILVTRIAEMYLISAEAQGLSGIDRLNELRAARGLAALDIDDADVYAEAVAEERRRELIYEGFRWFDLKRTGKAIEEVESITSEDQLLLPIPQEELDLNPLLEQNPGYN